MTIADQITRLNNAKAAIKTSIENKGVTVSNTAKLDEYAALIDSIEVGSGGNENDWLNIRTNGGWNYAYLFYGCYAESLDVSSLDTSKTTNMDSMFYMCSNLTTLDVSSFNTGKTTNMKSMFHMCSRLTTLDVSSFDTSQVTDMKSMFHMCSNLTTLDVSSFDTSNVTDMGYMFQYCESLASINLSSFDTSNVTDMGYMFQYCESLTELDLSNFNVSKVTSSSGLRIFGMSNMPQLTDFKAPKNIGTQFDVSKCTGLTHDSLMSIINNLATVTSTKKLVLGATNLAKLTDEEKAIATSKGWTLS